MKKKLIRPSLSEDRAITKAAKSDPDSYLVSDKEWQALRARVVKGRGRPLGSGRKTQVTLRIDRDTLDFYKSKGTGWQTFINQLLGEIKRESKSLKVVESRLTRGTLMVSKSKN
jgi:uncharacterized protein (DUF4415 family)